MDKDYQSWLWQKTGEKTVKNLEKHGINACLVETVEEAAQYVTEMISGYLSFGFAGSDTTRELGLPQKLKELGKTVYDHWEPGLSSEESLEIRKKQSQAECFLCSANAIAMTGEIINVDGVGNRTNGMSFGPKKVVIIAGMNKVTKDLDSALKRVHEIAAPMRSKSLDMDTPCAKTGICADCNSPQRICRITTIIHRQPMLTDMSVVLIKQALGF
ncbi:lactate utilization protein [bacterium]|nr:lactate utilization protein [bacterium]